MSSIQDTVSLCPAASSSGQGLRRSLCVPVNFGDERLPERFWSKVQPCPMSGCWLWVGYQIPNGYGVFSVKGLTGYAHRAAYQALIEAIPDGLCIDHLCRTRSCCNPLHLEVVTHRTNVLRGVSPSAVNARKTHCPKGHELTGANLVLDRGSRRCLKCRRACDLIRNQQPHRRARAR